jgi:hypothetical protein
MIRRAHLKNGASKTPWRGRLARAGGGMGAALRVVHELEASAMQTHGLEARVTSIRRLRRQRAGRPHYSGIGGMACPVLRCALVRNFPQFNACPLRMIHLKQQLICLK